VCSGAVRVHPGGFSRQTSAAQTAAAVGPSTPVAAV